MFKFCESYDPSGPDTSGWKARHHEAVRRGNSISRGIDAWAGYALGHQRRFKAPIAEDYFLGPAWLAWGKALRTLLNGELDGVDGGTLDRIILANMAEAGFPEADL